MAYNNKFGRNIIISISVQIISLSVSFILGFLVPKFIDEYQYANWQAFVLYVGYVGALHFGLLDGLVLRYSQYNYAELDKPRIRSQFKILLLTTGVIALLVSAVALFFTSGTSRLTIIFVAMGIVTKNLITYNSYSFQITNRINQYAALIIAQRVGYGLIVILLLLLRVNHFAWYCIADLAGDGIGVFLAQFYNKGMYFGKSIPAREAFAEWRENVASGIILMLANWSAMLLLGSAKMMVQWRWDKLTFGKVSFAFSISNLFLSFVTAISVVLFPQLKRMDAEKLPQIYRNIRGLLSPLLFAALLAYFPGCWILERYLPAYKVSLTYLGTLLPIIIYSSKVNLLTNNYLKAYRKEREMLRVNCISTGMALALFCIGCFVLGRLKAVLICVVMSVMLNSMLSEMVVMRTIHLDFRTEFFAEGAMTVAFILCNNLLDRWWAFGTYALLLAVYLAFHRREILRILKPDRPVGDS